MAEPQPSKLVMRVRFPSPARSWVSPTRGERSSGSLAVSCGVQPHTRPAGFAPGPPSVVASVRSRAITPPTPARRPGRRRPDRRALSLTFRLCAVPPGGLRPGPRARFRCPHSVPKTECQGCPLPGSSLASVSPFLGPGWLIFDRCPGLCARVVLLLTSCGWTFVVCTGPGDPGGRLLLIRGRFRGTRPWSPLVD